MYDFASPTLGQIYEDASSEFRFSLRLNFMLFKKTIIFQKDRRVCLKVLGALRFFLESQIIHEHGLTYPILHPVSLSDQNGGPISQYFVKI